MGCPRVLTAAEVASAALRPLPVQMAGVGVGGSGGGGDGSGDGSIEVIGVSGDGGSGDGASGVVPDQRLDEVPSGDKEEGGAPG